MQCNHRVATTYISQRVVVDAALIVGMATPRELVYFSGISVAAVVLTQCQNQSVYRCASAAIDVIVVMSSCLSIESIMPLVMVAGIFDGADTRALAITDNEVQHNRAVAAVGSIG